MAGSSRRALLCAASLTAALLAAALSMSGGQTPPPTTTTTPTAIRLRGLKQPVEILIDRWGVPHVYAQSADDLFFANGWINARDRLFQIDLWRRTGNGTLAEAFGPSAVPRDRMARLLRFRGDWNAEWNAYAPDAKSIVTAFTSGINAYIQSLNGKFPEEFRKAGYTPGLWKPEDCLQRVSALEVSQNVLREASRAQDIAQVGLAAALAHDPPEPPVKLTPPPEFPLDAITPAVLADYSRLLTLAPLGQGSNNWAVSGARTVSGKPILAADPHRSLTAPPLRRTIHLSAPGWNVIGAGEPALPGIALGHNDEIAFGFTITGIDQQDLYVERLNPANPDEYWHKGGWRRVTVERQTIPVKGGPAQAVELRFTIHGPLLHEDRARNRAFALRFTAAEPGGAAYLASLSLVRARNWPEFRAALARFRSPSENMVYADRAGNIGWAVAGLTPVRPNWTGLLPVPGSGDFEWAGFVPPDQLPSSFNPKEGFLATANHNILPPGYPRALAYDWGPPYRYQRIMEMLRAATKKLTVADHQRMQYDVVSIPARRLQALLRRTQLPPGLAAEAAKRLIAWDARIALESPAALIYEFWAPRLGPALFGSDLGARADFEVVLKRLENGPQSRVLAETLEETVGEIARYLGPNLDNWQLSRASRLVFRHPLGENAFQIGPLPRAGDAHTVNAAGGSAATVANGASYRQVIDLADWDQSTMTNAPGESGNPSSPHYRDLVEDWRAGRYHLLAFSRKTVESFTTERIRLEPAAR